MFYLIYKQNYTNSKVFTNFQYDILRILKLKLSKYMIGNARNVSISLSLNNCECRSNMILQQNL